MTLKSPRRKAVKPLAKTQSQKSIGIKRITVQAPPPPTPKARRKPKRTRTPKIDWPSVRRTYVQGIFDENAENPLPRRWPNNGEVAQLYNISEASVSLHVREGKWAAQRAAFQRDLHAQEDTKLAGELSDRRVRSQVAFATIGQNLASQVQLNVQAAVQKQRPLDPKSIRALAGGLRTAQDVVETAMGHPPDRDATIHNDWALFLTLPAAPIRQALPDIDADEPELGGVVTPPRGA